MGTAHDRQFGNMIFGIRPFRFSARRTAFVCNHEADVEHPGIIYKSLERDGGTGELGELGLTAYANGFRVWRLCIALGTGLHAWPPKLFSPIVI